MSPIQSVAAVGFWICLALVLYTYALYPVLIRVLARWFGRWEIAPIVADQELPTVSVLIVAHNEEDEIARSLRFVLELDYPSEKLEIVVASDGSTDRTTRVVLRFASEGVRLLDDPRRRGKAAVLNDAIPWLSGELVLLTDANTRIDRHAARRLARWFQRPEVGAVCGRLVLTDPQTGRNADSIYWKYETSLKRAEGRLGALLGANGALYALRKSIFQPIPKDTIIEDFVIPLQARLQTKCATVYDVEAVAFEETPPAVRTEFRRRARIGAGGYQSIGMLWKLLDPRQGWVALSFLSHKVLRWLCPFFLLVLLAANVVLLGEPLYLLALNLQVEFYLVAIVAACLPARYRGLKPLRLATMFASMNAALFLGFWNWLLGTQRGIWERTPRNSEAPIPEGTSPGPEVAVTI